RGRAPRGGAAGWERGGRRDGACGGLARPHDRRHCRDQHVEERRLVDVAHAVQGEGQGIPGCGQLARDLGVHPLARIVERCATEAREEERCCDEHRKGRRESGRQRACPIAVSTAFSTVWSVVIKGSSLSIHMIRSRLNRARSTVTVVRLPPVALSLIMSRWRVPFAWTP